MVNNTDGAAIHLSMSLSSWSSDFSNFPFTNSWLSSYPNGLNTTGELAIFLISAGPQVDFKTIVDKQILQTNSTTQHKARAATATNPRLISTDF